MLSETADHRAEPSLRADRSMLVLQYAIALLSVGAAGLLAFVR